MINHIKYKHYKRNSRLKKKNTIGINTPRNNLKLQEKTPVHIGNHIETSETHGRRVAKGVDCTEHSFRYFFSLQEEEK